MQLASNSPHQTLTSTHIVGINPDQILSELPRIDLMGIQLAAFDEAECVKTVLMLLGRGRGGNLLTMNLDHARRYFSGGPCRLDYDNATIRVADGMPLVWASRLIGKPLPQRITGSNLIFSLTASAAEMGYPVYFLGGNPGTAEASAKILQAESPKLKIAGVECPEFGFDHNQIEIDQMVDRVVQSGAKIIYVALGYPREEMVIKHLKERCPEAWIIGVGISFSFVSGDVKRAPRWMQKIGFEWLFRLIQEPKRLYPRYLLQGIPFFFKFMLKAAFNRN